MGHISMRVTETQMGMLKKGILENMWRKKIRLKLFSS